MQKMHDRKNIGKVILDPSLAPKDKVTQPNDLEANEDTDTIAF